MILLWASLAAVLAYLPCVYSQTTPIFTTRRLQISQPIHCSSKDKQNCSFYGSPAFNLLLFCSSKTHTLLCFTWFFLFYRLVFLTSDCHTHKIIAHIICQLSYVCFPFFFFWIQCQVRRPFNLFLEEGDWMVFVEGIFLTKFLMMSYEWRYKV